jgi:sugar phosphate isomerase/epimerase
MKIGGFGHIADYEAIRAAGFDYAELDLPEIEALSDEDFEAFLKRVEDLGFPVLTGARALPLAEPWFFTESYDPKVWLGYMERACERAARLGIKKIILGNGKARWLVDEHSIEQEQNFIQTLCAFADAAAKYGIEMILEPLGPDYSNYINTLPEAVRVIENSGNGNLFLMADLRHLYRGGESYADIPACKDYLHHVHVDYPCVFPARPFPRTDDGFDYAPFLAAVKEAGYDDTLTIEADIPTDWKAAHDEAMRVLEAVR